VPPCVRARRVRWFSRRGRWTQLLHADGGGSCSARRERSEERRRKARGCADNAAGVGFGGSVKQLSPSHSERFKSAELHVVPQPRAAAASWSAGAIKYVCGPRQAVPAPVSLIRPSAALQLVPAVQLVIRVRTAAAATHEPAAGGVSIMSGFPVRQAPSKQRCLFTPRLRSNLPVRRLRAPHAPAARATVCRPRCSVRRCCARVRASCWRRVQRAAAGATAQVAEARWALVAWLLRRPTSCALWTARSLTTKGARRTLRGWPACARLLRCLCAAPAVPLDVSPHTAHAPCFLRARAGCCWQA
jgi:hypothetical protein